MVGGRPPPCSSFSFTAIAPHQAVVIGGRVPDHGRTNTTYIVDFSAMVWTKLHQSGRGPWPVGRSWHAACCVQGGEGQSQLLVTGGVGNGLKILYDVWLLDPIQVSCKELSLPDAGKQSYLYRYGHAMAVFQLVVGLVEVAIFGGGATWDLKTASYDKETKVSDTTLIQLESVEVSGVDRKEWVVTGVAGPDQLGRPDRLREKRVKLRAAASDDLQHLGPPPEVIRQMVLRELQDALKHGYIPSDITTCLAWGAPGVGKTTLRYYLFGQLPPLIRVSTACIEPAQRALLAPSPDGGEVTCQPVDAQLFKTIIAEEVSGVMQEADGTQATPPSLHPSKLAASQVGHNRGHHPPQSITDTTASSTSDYSATPSAPANTIDGASSGFSLPLTRHELAVIADQSIELPPEMSEILDHLESSTESKPVGGVHWVHFMDSGGQGAFHHLISTLACNIALLVVVIKLSEKLSDRPDTEYYDHNSKSHQLGRFTLTNKQLLLKIAQFSFYHEPKFPFLYAKAAPTHPKVIVVGTFKDQENEEESIERKNELLKEALAPLQDQQLLIPRSDHEVIFPVNATLAGQDGEGTVASELRSAFQKHAPRLQIHLPSRWKLLELEIRKLGRRVVTRAECWKIAQALGFGSEDALEAALLYLHEANFFFYDPQILPGVVFVDPQAIVGVVTQLFELCTRLHEAAEGDVISKEDLRFRDQAIFTFDTIASLDIPFEGGLLSSEDVVNLLRHRLIAARVSLGDGNSYYFMPSLLRSLEPSDLQVTLSMRTAADPLLVTFPTGWAPSGLFCALLVELLSATSPLQLDVLSLLSSHIRVLHENVIELSAAGEGGSITLINMESVFEVLPSHSFPARLLSVVRKQIDVCLNRACATFSYRITHRFAFQCSCGELPEHPAVVSVSQEQVECPKDPGEVGPLSAKQIPWFQDNSTADTSHPVAHRAVQTDPSAASYPCVHKAVQTDHSAGLRPHHKHNPRYPGVTFLGSPLLQAVDAHGQELSLPEMGVSLTIPPGAVPQGDVVKVSIWPCLSGPFVPPEGYEFASPVYQISPSFSFQQDVQLTLQHFASLTSKEDCDHMVFMSAKISSDITGRSPEYQFRVLTNAKSVFRKYSTSGTLQLRHFCRVAAGRKGCRQDSGAAKKASVKKSKDNSIYSVQVYQASVARRVVTVLGFSLCQPLYLSNLRKNLKEDFPNVNWYKMTRQPLTVVDREINIQPKLSAESSGWNLVANREPCVISLSEVDFPLHHPDSFYLEDYPPTIRLDVLPQVQNPQPTSCSLRVQGIAEDVTLRVVVEMEMRRDTEPAVLHASGSYRQSASPPSPGCVLTDSDLPSLMRLLSDAAHHTHQLGIQLGIGVSQILTLKQSSSGDPCTHLSLVLDHWLKRTSPPPSLQTLIEALSNPPIRNETLGHLLQQTFSHLHLKADSVVSGLQHS